jgi:3-isopropylmalate/(R)-2-methylmalate dehydratase small subunit
MKLAGRVWKLGDRIGATELVPARYDDDGVNDRWSACATHFLEDVDPKIAGAVRQGDIIVAGTELGCGHAHYYRAAIMTCKAIGLGGLFGETTHDLFQRAAIDQGLAFWAFPGLSAFVETGDRLELDLSSGEARNLTNGRASRFEPLSPIILDILRMGGSYDWARERARAKRAQASQQEA